MNLIDSYVQKADAALSLIEHALNGYKHYIFSACEIEYYYNRYKPLFLKAPDKLNELHKLLENTFPSKCPPIGTGFVGYKILKTKKIISQKMLKGLVHLEINADAIIVL